MFLTSLFALSLLPDATAADFTGRVRRIRIRENQTDTSFRAVIATEGDTSPVDTSVSFTAEDEDTGAVVDGACTLQALRREDTIAWSATTKGTPAYVSLTNGTDTYATDLAVGAWSEVDLKDGTVLRLRVDAGEGGYTLTGELVGTKSGGVSAVHKGATFATSVATDESGSVVLVGGKLFDGSGETWTGRWVSAKVDGEGFGGRALVDARWRDYGDRVLDDEDDSLIFLGAAEGTGVVEASIGRINARGVQRLTVYTVGAAGEAPDTLDITVEDADSGTEVATGELAQAVETTRIFTVPALELDPTTATVAEVHVLAGDEDIVAGTVTLPAVGAVVTADSSSELLINLHKLATYDNGDGTTEVSFSLGGSYGADDVQVYVLFSAGCDPTDASCGAVSYDAVDDGSFERWVLPFKGDPNAATYGVGVDVRGADGEIVDATVFEATAGFGFGTRSTAGQAHGKTELL